MSSNIARNTIIRNSVLLSVFTLIVSFVSRALTLVLDNDAIILEVLRFPANLAFIFGYFSGDAQFYLVCLIELIVLFINYCMCFYFWQELKKFKN